MGQLPAGIRLDAYVRTATDAVEFSAITYYYTHQTLATRARELDVF